LQHEKTAKNSVQIIAEPILDKNLWRWYTSSDEWDSDYLLIRDLMRLPLFMHYPKALNR